MKEIIISADGGGSSVVKAEISAAMEALFGLPSHKIKVLKRNFLERADMDKYTFSTQSGKAYYCNSIPEFIKDNIDYIKEKDIR